MLVRILSTLHKGAMILVCQLGFAERLASRIVVNLEELADDVKVHEVW